MWRSSSESGGDLQRSKQHTSKQKLNKDTNNEQTSNEIEISIEQEALLHKSAARTVQPLHKRLHTFRQIKRGKSQARQKPKTENNGEPHRAGVGVVHDEVLNSEHRIQSCDVGRGRACSASKGQSTRAVETQAHGFTQCCVPKTTLPSPYH